MKNNPFVDFINRFKHDRVAFVRLVLGAIPEPWQEKELKALDDGEKRTSIRSGHGVGKTTLLAWVIIHFVITRIPCKVAVTAPTSGQLFDALANEVKVWIGVLEERVPALKNVLTPTSDRVFLTAAPEMAFVSYKTSRRETPEALQGVHAEHVLLVADEAAGVDDAVFESAAGSMSTKGAITILAGNPSYRSGFFYDTHTKLSEFWRSVKVSGFDSSRVSKDYIEEEKKFGEASNRYRIRVLGEFPLANEDTLIPYHLVDEASRREIKPSLVQEPIFWGLDVARSLQGDRSALAKRQGNLLLEPIKTWRFPDTMQLVGAVKLEWDFTPERQRPEAIFVDVIGWGAGVTDRLRELELPAYAVNVSESPPVTKNNAVKLRDELWINVRDWFMSRNVAGPFDEETKEELSSPTIRYPNGKMKVESKDEMKARLNGKSPDKADSLMLTFARTGAAAAGVMAGSSWRKGPLRRANTGRV